MIPPLYKWYPMVQPGGEPNRTDALERRAERLTEDYKQALKMKKVDIKTYVELAVVSRSFHERLAPVAVTLSSRSCAISASY